MGSLGSLARKYKFFKKRADARIYKKKHMFLRGAPMVAAYVRKVFEKSPKKPHSGKRACTQVVIFPNKKRKNDFYEKQRFVFITGTGVKKSVGVNARLLVRGGRRRDLPAVLYTLVRGKLNKTKKSYADTALLYGKPHRNARSKYGMKRPGSDVRRESDLAVGALRAAETSLALDEDQYRIGSMIGGTVKEDQDTDQKGNRADQSRSNNDNNDDKSDNQSDDEGYIDFTTASSRSRNRLASLGSLVDKINANNEENIMDGTSSDNEDESSGEDMATLQARYGTYNTGTEEAANEASDSSSYSDTDVAFFSGYEDEDFSEWSSETADSDNEASSSKMGDDDDGEEKPEPVEEVVEQDPKLW